MNTKRSISDIRTRMACDAIEALALQIERCETQKIALLAVLRELLETFEAGLDEDYTAFDPLIARARAAIAAATEGT